MNAPLRKAIARAVRTALEEDLGSGDATTTALFPAPLRASATILPRHALTVAGVAAACEAFHQVDPAITIVSRVEDGARLDAREPVLMAEGDGRSLLAAERVALNFLQHLSGVATLTARFCEAVRGYPTRILDTRKTLPGLRLLQKWAVRLGGGINHRFSLADGLLIKDNHLALIRGQGRTLADACRLARTRGPHGLTVIAEAASLAEVKEALTGQADVILLDNMGAAEVSRAVALIKGRALVEVSGGVSLANARELAAAGADFLSIGALTHSAPAADLSLDLTPCRSRTPHRSPRAR